ncbi:neurotoxin 3FTx-8a-like [Megalobrama amblycephala]|uniref:neurotoxin 3FTx-8a-like n=1 Tax=Megalobrama amblycephala TaxID=75352 RepID=UPI002014242D|nr:neurotoxin 3FTx-8a-like [Megalobrama amblycephala]XP_048022190.1 neurotoxin 3FTx-8a-like [Megalobrama amblycephala]
MDLRVSVVLLFIFLTGGYSLQCYVCTPDWTGYCQLKLETCPDDCSACTSCEASLSNGYKNMTFRMKGCASQCQDAKIRTPDGISMEVRCCKSDRCNAANAADGVFKGSFLLLFSPLPFYFLFQ